MKTSKRNLLGIIGAAIIAWACLPSGAARADGDAKSSGLYEPETRWGLGVRLRQVRMPESMIELFVEDAPGGGTHLGYGVELVRQKGNFTLALGVEYEKLHAQDGIWIDKGDQIPRDPVDWVEFRDFGWIGADISFIWQSGLISDVLFFRYGAGLGLGILQGEILQTDFVCTTDQTDSCMRDPNATNIDQPADIPPVFPIINVTLGAQIRPVKNIAINIEGGIRTVPFVGTTVLFMY